MHASTSLGNLTDVQQVRDAKLTPAGAQSRLQRDPRFRQLSDGAGALLHQIIVYCEKTNGVLILNKTKWSILTKNICRKTVLRRFQTLQDYGILVYTPGLGRGNLGSVQLCIRNWGGNHGYTRQKDTPEKETKKPEKGTPVSTFSNGPYNKNARACFSQVQNNVRYPQPPSAATPSPEAVKAVRWFHDKFEKPQSERTPYFLRREHQRMDHILENYSKKEIRDALRLLQDYYRNRVKKPVSVGMVAYYCENYEGIKRRHDRVERQRKYHARKAAEAAEQAALTKPETPQAPKPRSYEEQLRQVLGLTPHQPLPEIPVIEKNIDMSLKDEFLEAVQPMKWRILSHSFERCIMPLKPISHENGVWTVTGTGEFVLEQVAVTYRKHLEKVLGERIEVVKVGLPGAEVKEPTRTSPGKDEAERMEEKRMEYKS